MLQDLIQGKYETFRKTENPTFSEYANRYIKSVKWQKRTVQIVENLVKFFRKNRLTQITTQDFIDYRTMRLETVKTQLSTGNTLA